MKTETERAEAWRQTALAFEQRAMRVEAVLRELVAAQDAWIAVHPIRVAAKAEAAEERLALAWKNARAEGVPQPVLHVEHVAVKPGDTFAVAVGRTVPAGGFARRIEDYRP